MLSLEHDIIMIAIDPVIVHHNLSVSTVDLIDEVSEFVLLELHYIGRHRSIADHQTVHCRPCGKEIRS